MGLSNEEMIAKARELPIPDPWNREKFIQDLAELRGRPIRLIATDTASLVGSPCGLWIIRRNDDIILHERDTSDYHIDQIVRHEIGHMVLGHERTHIGEVAPDTSSELFRKALPAIDKVLPAIDPSAIRAVLGRMDFASEQEREAETFASLLMIAAHEQENSDSMMRNVFFRRRSR